MSKTFFVKTNCGQWTTDDRLTSKSPLWIPLKHYMLMYWNNCQQLQLSRIANVYSILEINVF